MAEFFNVDQEVLDICDEMMESYHPRLTEVTIGLCFRDEAPRTKGVVKMAEASKLPPKFRAFVGYDFVIWFAQDVWITLSVDQKRALVDHELCHCEHDGDKASIRPHDVEEFAEIIERHGFWWPYAQQFRRAVQLQFEFAVSGAVAINNKDVLDQISGMFGAEGNEDERGNGDPEQDSGDQ